MKNIDELIQKLTEAKEELSKNTNMSYAAPANTGSGSSSMSMDSMAMSEECHPDDPRHEEKEQTKAKKIKETAEDILDMHKACGSMEKMCIDKNGQWSLEKAKYEQGKTPAQKAHIRQNRKGITDKLDEREVRGIEGGGHDSKVHWRKPKSGEGHIKIGPQETQNIHEDHGFGAAPKAGKAHTWTTGGSSMHTDFQHTQDRLDDKITENRKPKLKLVKHTNGQWALEDLEKSVYNAGTHPPKGYNPDKKMSKPGKNSWHALNSEMHSLEESGGTGNDRHRALAGQWEKETGEKYKPGRASQEIEKADKKEFGSYKEVGSAIDQAFSEADFNPATKHPKDPTAGMPAGKKPGERTTSTGFKLKVAKEDK